MDCLNRKQKSPKEHIAAIFEDYEASARVLQTLTNLSNAVIETALNGQCKFLFEIIQNADDAFDESSKYENIKLQLISKDNYFIIQHNGKAFDYYDVERICDYASQIEEVKANDLSKTGYKGLGFKSLFNLSDCIYIYSNGYSFRFDKNYWSDPEKKPWQVIPIWSEDLPLNEKFSYDQPVNFILKITDTKQLNIQLKELIYRSESLLYLHRVNIVDINQNGVRNTLERKKEKFGLFHKIVFLKNQQVANTWFSKSYEMAIPSQLKKCIREVSQFIYPDKIKNAEQIDITFALCTNQKFEDAVKIDGYCYSTLPTQLKLSFPYHINSLFILNLDRTQFHENEWNEFLIYQIGYLQLSFLKDLAEVPHLRNFIIRLLVRNINHPYNVFNKAFSKGFEVAEKEVAWLPAYEGSFLKLGEACVDKIEFFKQNFQNIQNIGYIIDYDVKSQNLLLANEVKYFDFDSLIELFPQKYYPELTESSYIKFLSYIYEISQIYSVGSRTYYKLMKMPFLKTKNKILVPPTEALLEEEGNPIPIFTGLNPVDNQFLPSVNRDKFKKWLVDLGAEQLETPIQILRKSVFQWMDSNTLKYKMNIDNHEAIINYLANNFQQFSYTEALILAKRLLILTKSNKFNIATLCCQPNAISLAELREIMSDDKIISSSYDAYSLKDFFSYLGIPESLNSVDVFRNCILVLIKDKQIKSKLTIKNYKPIIEYLSSEYLTIHYLLNGREKKLLEKLPILTCTQTFNKAKNCYFDTVIPNVKGFEDIIDKQVLVSTDDLTENVCKFFSSIGVKEKIDPLDVFRNSVLKWITDGTVKTKINMRNHHDILNYIAEFWDYSCYLNTKEKEILKKLPVLTESNTFREVSSCYSQTTGTYTHDEKIPKLKCIVSEDELASSEYYTDEKEKTSKIEALLDNLGIRHLNFVDICYRYCDHLTDSECIKWFFSHLVTYWEGHSSYLIGDKLLPDLKVRLSSSCVLAKNGKIYPMKELYSSAFLSMHDIDEDAVPILDFDDLPTKLERWLGIKQELDMQCLIKLLETVGKKGNLGQNATVTFFKKVLEQLRMKDKNVIRKYSLKLLSQDNKLTFAKDLHYFREKEAKCLADSYYLKRIHGMSHKDTLELAELCGVNLLDFKQEINYGEKTPVYDRSLRDFYLERLPFIVLLESKELNEPPENVLKKLFLKITSFELYKCHTILIRYPFGKPAKKICYFDHSKIYVAKKWKSLKSKICNHIGEILKLKSDITEILDIESVCEDEIEFLECLDYEKNREKLLMIKEELKQLLSDYGTTIEYNTVDDSITDNELIREDSDFEQAECITEIKKVKKRNRNRGKKSVKPTNTAPEKMLNDSSYDDPYLKRLGEKYVFTYLQEYYKNKYLDRQIKSDHAHFILQCQSSTTELIWVNDDENKGLGYDFLLKKNEEIKHYIKVKPIKQTSNDLINLTNLGITRGSKFIPEHEENNAKYSVYCIFYKGSSPTSLPEIINVTALYKIATLKVLSV